MLYYLLEDNKLYGEQGFAVSISFYNNLPDSHKKLFSMSNPKRIKVKASKTYDELAEIIMGGRFANQNPEIRVNPIPNNPPQPNNEENDVQEMNLDEVMEWVGDDFEDNEFYEYDDEEE